jgi:biopolymer transport protein ExbD
MNTPKKKRVGIKMDMTPMVDVAFLLLTFFMLTTQFKTDEGVELVLPKSHSAFKLPDKDVMIISIDQGGIIHLGLDSPRIRMQLFGPVAGKAASVVVTVQDLPQLLVSARMANPKLRTVIKGDKNAPYGPVQDVMDILQKTKITRFNLVTDLEQAETT